MNEITRIDHDALASIDGCSFLEEQDSLALVEMGAELSKCYREQKIWRSELAMRVSVLNSTEHPTPHDKMRQATLEQTVFFSNLVELSFDYRKKLVEIDRLKHNAEHADNEFDRADAQIDMERAIFHKRNMEIQARERMREIKTWEKIKGELRGEMAQDDGENADLIATAKRGILRFDALLIHASKASDPAACKNIRSLAAEAVKAAIKAGVIERVLEGIPEDTVTRVMGSLGYKAHAVNDSGESAQIESDGTSWWKI